MLYKNKKAVVHSLDVDTIFFVAGVLQADISAPFLAIIYERQ